MKGECGMNIKLMIEALKLADEIKDCRECAVAADCRAMPLNCPIKKALSEAEKHQGSSGIIIKAKNEVVSLQRIRKRIRKITSMWGGSIFVIRLDFYGGHKIPLIKNVFVRDVFWQDELDRRWKAIEDSAKVSLGDMGGNTELCIWAERAEALNDSLS
jgi:hypothetical protein